MLERSWNVACISSLGKTPEQIEAMARYSADILAYGMSYHNMGNASSLDITSDTTKIEIKFMLGEL